MAHIRRDGRNGTWFVGFRYDGREFQRSCRTDRKPIARRVQTAVEETIDLLQTGRLVVPEGVEIGSWILSGGKATKPRKKPGELRLGVICEAYKADQTQKAESSQGEERIHIKHLTRILRSNIRLNSVDLATLKSYAMKRSQERFRGRLICSKTIRKELATFRRIWAWAEQHGHIAGICPLLGPSGRWKLQLPKPPEKTRFQTRAQIERRIGRGGLSGEAIDDLWKGLYLDEAQISSMLVHIKKNALHPFIYPMFAFTTYTGARRSEVVRAHIDDVDFDSNQIMIRERKRRKHLSASTRFVPLHPQLRSILQEWLAIHPGASHLFVRANVIPKGPRQAAPKKLTLDQATHHFKQTLRESEHSVVAGFHVLRHSFGSNLVRSGRVPPHVVAQWMGHTTEEMKQLYQHLFPQDGVAQISVLQ